jgi:hypothetical protein
MEELAWLTRAPRWIKRLFFALVDVLVWERVRRRLNAFRDGIGLPALQSFFHDALHGAEGVAALFPRWFAAPQPDWPGRVRQFGFPIVSKTRPLSDSLENFLESVSRRWYGLTAQPILISGIFNPGRLRSRASSISDVLRQFLASATIFHRCREFQQRVLKTDTLSDVLDWAEQIARESRDR